MLSLLTSVRNRQQLCESSAGCCGLSSYLLFVKTSFNDIASALTGICLIVTMTLYQHVHVTSCYFSAVQTLQEEVVQMKQERVAHEEDLERKRKELQRSLISGFMQNRAARCIQSHWAAYLQAKKKAAKEAAKSKGKGK